MMMTMMMMMAVVVGGGGGDHGERTRILVFCTYQQVDKHDRDH